MNLVPNNVVVSVKLRISSLIQNWERGVAIELINEILDLAAANQAKEYSFLSRIGLSLFVRKIEKQLDETEASLVEKSKCAIEVIRAFPHRFRVVEDPNLPLGAQPPKREKLSHYDSISSPYFEQIYLSEFNRVMITLRAGLEAQTEPTKSPNNPIATVAGASINPEQWQSLIIAARSVHTLCAEKSAELEAKRPNSKEALDENNELISLLKQVQVLSEQVVVVVETTELDTEAVGRIQAIWLDFCKMMEKHDPAFFVKCSKLSAVAVFVAMFGLLGFSATVSAPTMLGIFFGKEVIKKTKDALKTAKND